MDRAGDRSRDEEGGLAPSSRLFYRIVIDGADGKKVGLSADYAHVLA